MSNVITFPFETTQTPFRLEKLPLNEIQSIQFEQILFQAASNFSKDYTGAMWVFATLPNGFTFAYPNTTTQYKVSNPYNWFDGVVDAKTFGYMLTLLAYGNFGQSEKAMDAYFGLRGLLNDESHRDNPAFIEFATAVYHFLD